MLDKDETLVAEDLRRAASVAMERQFLFGDKSRDQRHFLQILDAEDYYRNLFDALNLSTWSATAPPATSGWCRANRT